MSSLINQQSQVLRTAFAKALAAHKAAKAKRAAAVLPGDRADARYNDHVTYGKCSGLLQAMNLLGLTEVADEAGKALIEVLCQ